MDDENYRELQAILIRYPMAGDLIKGSGGLRKIRWKIKGSGKRGGVRIIYYWAKADEQLRTPMQLKTLRQIVERWADE